MNELDLTVTIQTSEISSLDERLTKLETKVNGNEPESIQENDLLKGHDDINFKCTHFSPF